jgi:hypothetical protein
VAPSAASDRTARQRIIVKTASVVKHWYQDAVLATVVAPPRIST